MADLKAVYAAVDEQAALNALDTFGERWDKKYPKIAQSWRANWANLSTYFKYPQEVRRLIYTTNTMEGFNRQLRKVTKAKSVFPTDDSLLKMLYLAMIDDITKKWTGRRQDWNLIHAQMAIYIPSVCLSNTAVSDVKGKKTVLLSLTSIPTGVILLKRRQPDEPAAALNKYCSIRTLNGVYTEFEIAPSSSYKE